MDLVQMEEDGDSSVPAGESSAPATPQVSTPRGFPSNVLDVEQNLSSQLGWCPMQNQWVSRWTGGGESVGDAVEPPVSPFGSGDSPGRGKLLPGPSHAQ